MRFSRLLPLTVVLVSFMASCSFLFSPYDQNLSTIVENTCFEVVIPRNEGDQIVYEKELPWQDIPIHIRDDEYQSIGTAFAVAPDRFITAAHVLSLMDDSMFYTDYYIRDADKNVYPITDLLRFDNEKDFAEFTVEGFKARRFLKFRQRPYVLNERVYQIGNIYGQGIVSVPGAILDDREEERNGAWMYIKSAPPNDRGSSGGPLVDAEMKVLGVIDFKDNYFSHSLPVSEIASSPADKGIIYAGRTHAFSLMFGESSDVEPFTMELALPMDLREVKKAIRTRYMESYEQSMSDFIEDEGGLFPEGSGSLEALHDASTSTGIQIVYRDEDDQTWYFSSLDKNRSRLGKDGSVRYSSIDGVVYFDIDMPDEMEHDDLYQSSKTVLDTFIGGSTFSRLFAGDWIRVDTLGEPILSDSVTDRYGRKWHMDTWAIEYADEVATMMWVAVPSGVAGFITFVDSSDLDMWHYDMKLIAGLVYIPYFASLEQWTGYLEHPESANGPYADMELSYVPERSLSVENGEFSLALSSGVLEVDDRMEMQLSRDFFENKGEMVWDLRKITLGEWGRDNYFVSYRFLEPSPDLPDGFLREWTDLIGGYHPYDSSAYAYEGRTDIGDLHPQFNSADGSGFSVYLGIEGSHSQNSMVQGLNEVRQALKFKF